jgi:hypothetical protein
VERSGTLARVLGATLLLFGCGSTASQPQKLPGSSGAAASNGGASGGAASGGAASGGAASGGAASGGAHAEPIALEPDVQTLWGMFAFEDPVAIELRASAHQLFGVGCFAGRALDPQQGPNTCDPLHGTIEGRHLEFSFPAGQYTYAADVYISSNQQRMAGKFHDTGGWRTDPTAWLPLQANERWLSEPVELDALKTALESRAGAYDLEDMEDPAAEPLHLRVASDTHSGTIFSSLGAFWGTEVSWNEQEQLLTAGPVPETVPDLPIQLTLHFDGELLLRVDALAPSGEVRAYAAARARP